MNKGKTLVLLAFLVAASLASAQENDSSSTMADKVFTVGGVTFCMKPVQGGTFTMGASEVHRKAAEPDERPAHEVTVSTFYMGETEVTQALWVAVMGDNPSYFRGNDLPVQNVSYNDITKVFLPRLERMTGQKFRLPTEAEWEFAASGGHTAETMYSGDYNYSHVAWYVKNSAGHPHQVKTKQPNELGLYDMSGNVWEWCSDWYGANYYSSDPQTDPQGPMSGTDRVQRGGGWYSNEKSCRVSYRGYTNPGHRHNFLGFRIACCP